MLHTASDFEYLSQICATESGRMGWKVVEWICVALKKDKWWTVRNMMMGLRFPSNSGNFSTSRASVSFSISKKANLGLNQYVDFSMRRLEGNIKNDPKRHSVLMRTTFIRGRIWNSNGLCEHGKEFSNSTKRGELNEWESLDQAEGGQPRELPSPLSAGQGHFLKCSHASVYTWVDLLECSDATILISHEPTSAHFRLKHNR